MRPPERLQPAGPELHARRMPTRQNGTGIVKGTRYAAFIESIPALVH